MADGRSAGFEHLDFALPVLVSVVVVLDPLVDVVCVGVEVEGEDGSLGVAHFCCGEGLPSL